MEPAIHSAAAQGFGNEAGRYQKGRPDYPAGVALWLSEDLGLGSGKTVLDLGAGTGRFTRWMASTGARVIAVEPVAAMRTQLKEAMPDMEVHAGTAEKIPLGDESVDAVVCAQALHWFSTPEAIREIRRVIRPGGCLGLIWNVRDESIPWVAEITRMMSPYEEGTPRYASGEWRRLFPAPGFGPLEETVFPHQHCGDFETVIIDRTLSTSFIAALPEDEKAALADDLRHWSRGVPDLCGEEICFPYQTHAYRCLRE